MAGAFGYLIRQSRRKKLFDRIVRLFTGIKSLRRSDPMLRLLDHLIGQLVLLSFIDV